MVDGKAGVPRQTLPVVVCEGLHVIAPGHDHFVQPRPELLEGGGVGQFDSSLDACKQNGSWNLPEYQKIAPFQTLTILLANEYSKYLTK